MNKREVHKELQDAYTIIDKLRFELDDAGVSMITAFTIGEALGILSRARFLVSRDIDKEGKS